MKKLICIFISVLLLLTVVLPAAASATPSVTLRYPKLAVREYVVDGKTVSGVGVFRDAAGAIVKVLTADELALTPAELKDTASAAVKALLTDAEKDLTDKTALASLKDTLDAMAKKIYPTLDSSDLAVRNIFDISLIGAMAPVYQADGTLKYDGKVVSLETTIDLSLGDKEVTPLFIYACEADDAWAALDTTAVVREKNDNVTVSFAKLCAVSTLTVSAQALKENPELASPSTAVEDMSRNYPMAAVSLTASLVLIGALSLLKKKVK